MQLNKRLKSKKKKRKVKIEENDTEGEAFQSLNKEQSYEFVTSDAKAMTFNNEKGPLTRSELSESSFEKSNEFSSQLRGIKYSTNDSNEVNYMKNTFSSKQRSDSKETESQRNRSTSSIKHHNVVKAKNYKSLSSSNESHNKFKKTSKFKVYSESESSESLQDDDKEKVFCNYKEIINQNKPKEKIVIKQERKAQTRHSRAVSPKQTKPKQKESKKRQKKTFKNSKPQSKPKHKCKHNKEITELQRFSMKMFSLVKELKSQISQKQNN